MSAIIPLPTNGSTQDIYPGGYQDAVTAKNSGPNKCYVDSDTSPVTGGFELSPGSTIVWDANRPMFAACLPGFPSQLTLTPNGGNLFDASAVASQILAQGLADDIATALFAGGIPVVERETVLDDTLWPLFNWLDAVSITAPNGGGTYDVSKALSLVIRWTTGDAVVRAIEVNVKWFDAQAHLIAVDTFTMPNKGTSTMWLPVKGATAQFTLVNHTGVTITANVGVLTVVTSQRGIPAGRMRSNSPTQQGWVGDPYGQTWDKKVITYPAAFPSPAAAYQARGGRCRLTVFYSNAQAAAGTLALIDVALNESVDVIQLPVGPAFSTVSTELILPPRLLQFNDLNGIAAAATYPTLINWLD